MPRSRQNVMIPPTLLKKVITHQIDVEFGIFENIDENINKLTYLTFNLKPNLRILDKGDVTGTP